MKAPAHFCRDGHEPIWHNDSEHEICPLCRAEAALTQALAERDEYKQAADESAVMLSQLNDEHFKAEASLLQVRAAVKKALAVWDAQSTCGAQLRELAALSGGSEETK